MDFPLDVGRQVVAHFGLRITELDPVRTLGADAMRRALEGYDWKELAIEEIVAGVNEDVPPDADLRINPEVVELLIEEINPQGLVRSRNEDADEYFDSEPLAELEHYLESRD